jgi:hypothetical protein
MRVKPLAFDSLGTRSMATYVETGDVRILIDPGVALGPSRYGLPPHPLEYSRLEEHWGEIRRHSGKSDVLIVTHYHYDHHNPEHPELYADKVVLLKHPASKINKSQRGRAAYFLEKLGDLPASVDYCDGREYAFGDTMIRFSKPVYHGTNPRLGYVVEVSVTDGDQTFLFTSDVEGPSLDDQVNFITNENPNIIFADGPMTYMLGFRYSKESLRRSIDNLRMVLRETWVRDLVVDHHLLRDLGWKDKLSRLFEDAGRTRVLTAAEYSGVEPELLEARRKELYGG